MGLTQTLRKGRHMSSPSQKTDLDNMSRLAARCYMIGANMLDAIDEDTWKKKGFSNDDVIIAKALAALFLRINSIELGLKHILVNEIKCPLPKKDRHNLVALWDRLSEKWRHLLSRDTNNIRQTLERYKNTSVAARFGGSFGVAPVSDIPSRQDMLSDAHNIQILANILGELACPPITTNPVEKDL